MYRDKALDLADCSRTSSSRRASRSTYATHGFTEPRRCPYLRASHKAAVATAVGPEAEDSTGYSDGSGGDGGGGGGGCSRGPREMFTATCSKLQRGIGSLPAHSSRPRLCSNYFALRRA